MEENPLRRIKRYRLPIIIGGILIAAVAVFLIVRMITRDEGQEQVDLPPPDISSETETEVSGTGSQGSGVLISLSEGQAQPQVAEPVAQASGEPLTEEEIEGILVRLNAMAEGAEDQVDFNLPEESLPPPRTGETIAEAFPPPPEESTPETVEAGPLEVLRFAPEGEIPLAPFINITFNQPMVPLTSLEDLAAEEVPVQVEPALPGTWRWVGTKTLNFQYDSTLIDRLPMATEYQVTVPAGTKSATGGVLAEEVSWTFSTPPPKITNHLPIREAPQPRDALIYIAFDQRIDPQEVLDIMRVTADGEAVSVRLATEAEIKEDETLSHVLKSSGEGRWLAFRSQELLPADSAIQVSIPAGMPSAEGPLVTTQEQGFSFHTYAPLRIVEHRCQWYATEDNCPPLTPFTIRFNNPIDTQAWQEGLLRIEPELPGASVNVYGDTIHINGASQGQTTYKVTVSAEVQDIFGQTLGEETTLTFKVGTAEPFLVGPDRILVTLDPAARTPVLSLYTVNYNRLELKIYAVEPSDWPAFQTYLREYQRTDSPPSPPGRLVRDETMRLEIPTDKLTEVGIDLSEHMDGDYGHFIVIARPDRGLFQNDEDRYWEIVQVWVQVTQIGLDAFADRSEMVAWTTDLKDGAPLGGVTIESDSTDLAVVTTGEDGVARFDLPDDGASYIVARKGADRAILPRYDYYWAEDAWRRMPANDELRWYVFDDRQMYRPGEEAHFKGWLRRVGGKVDGDVSLVGDTVNSVRYRIYDPQGNELESGEIPVNALGGFDLAFSLPENANLGYASLQLEAMGNLSGLDNIQGHHQFQIQEFRTPEFEVNARNETVGPYFADEHAIVAVEAKYYAGGPLPNADVTWNVTSTPTNYAPPNWPDFTFGIWEPWWWYSERFYYEGPYGGVYETFTGTTDATGNHYLRLDFEAQETPRPSSVLAEATVIDVNRQAWAGTTSLLVHPADLYAGLRSERTFVERGTPLEIELIVTDLDGNAIADRQIRVTAARLEWKYRGSDWREEEVDVQECTVGSQVEPVSCTFETPQGGRYRITAFVTDSLGRQNMSQFERWVSGGELPPARKVEQETLTLIPDKESYQPGDTAEILVQAPFSPAEGLLTASRNGILYTERFSIEDGTATLRVPIEERHIPNLNIQVDIAGSAPRTDDRGEVLEDVPRRPAFASGQITLDIPALGRTLALEISPRETELEPGGETTIDILLKDAQGQPVEGAELAVVVVDEAILALSSYQLPDPIGVFYTHRPSYLYSVYGRASIVLVDPLALAREGGVPQLTQEVVEESVVEGEMRALATPAPAMEAPAADMSAAQAQPEPIRVRSDFNPLAVFSPEVTTDSDGEAHVEVKLPDNLTRYRVMVVAVDASGRQFGSGEANLTARLPLMARPSAPRFLNFGDNFELPVVLQNQTDEPLVTEVVVRASNLELTGASGLRVSVPANDRVEVRFAAKTEMAGTARFQVAAVSGEYADAAEVELPVYTPATTEAFAVYGVVDEGAVLQPVASPSDVFSQFGGLEVSTSSTALQALTDAVLYLVSYPFECSEQLASRILAIAALRDVLSAFEAEGLPTPEAMESSVEDDIEELRGLQNFDGGFPYWRRGQESIPYNTVHVAHALQRAERMGFEVPGEMKSQVLEYLRNIEDHYPSWYDKEIRWTISAYALYVRDLMGDGDPGKARRLFDEAGVEALALEASAWLWQVLLDTPGSEDAIAAIERHISNRAVETAGAANFTVSYSDNAYVLLHSSRRSDAVILDALIAGDPGNDLIPKVVNGLLAHRTQGRWNSTQENVFVLLALERYFKTFEAQTPDFVARIWLGETYAGEHQYEGRTTERHETDIPMSYLVGTAASGETQDLILSKEGPGRLYYRLGLRYAPSDLTLEPLDMGFVVERSYEAVDDPEDVYRDEDGRWHMRAGARVRVRLTMVADNRRYHVALVDPLPAGLEIVNPALDVSGSIPQDPSSPDYRYGWWWWGPWYEHQNMRDERAEAFTPLLWEGVYEYTYIARATTPGTFVVPPTKAEEMYSPEVFGRSGSDWVIVE